MTMISRMDEILQEALLLICSVLIPDTARVITGPMPHPSSGGGVPRCELYLSVDDLETACSRAQVAGAQVVDAAVDRDRGHRVAYFADHDGHAIALATES